MFDNKAFDGIIELGFVGILATVFLVLSLIVGIFVDVTSQTHLIVGVIGAIAGYVIARRLL